MMSNKDKSMVADLIAWFGLHANDRNIWQTPVGKILKQQLSARGNFRNAPRGKPGVLNFRNRRRARFTGGDLPMFGDGGMNGQ